MKELQENGVEVWMCETLEIVLGVVPCREDWIQYLDYIMAVKVVDIDEAIGILKSTEQAIRKPLQATS